MSTPSTIDCHPAGTDTLIRKRCCVLVPPEYGSEGRTFPVVYLLHGIRETETDWRDNRQIIDLLDTLRRAAYVPPMVIVMPYGFLSEAERTDGRMPDRAAFDRHLMELVAEVTGAYPRISPVVRHHAIAGISMGGKQAIEVGLTHPEYFSTIGALSAAIQRSRLHETFPVLADPLKLRQQLKFFFSRCGRRDAWRPDGSRRTERYDLAELNEKFSAHLQKAGVDCDASVDDGYHNWDFWLPQLAPLFTSLGVALAPSLAVRWLIQSILMAIHTGIREDQTPSDDTRTRLRLAKPAAWPADKYAEVLFASESLPDCLGELHASPPPQWTQKRARWKEAGLADGGEDFDRLYAGFFDACEEILASSIAHHGDRVVDLYTPMPAAHWRVGQAATRSALVARPWKDSAPPYAQRKWVRDVPVVLLRGQTSEMLATLHAARAALGPAYADDATERARRASAGGSQPSRGGAQESPTRGAPP